MRRMFRAITALLLIAVATPVATAAEAPQVDAAVQVTGARDPFRAFASPAVAVHPRDRSTIVIGHGEARSSGCGVHFSTNAGLSWTEGASPLLKDVAACVRNTNGPLASVAFTPDGTLLYAFAGYPRANDFHSKIYVARSTDLGRSFQTTAIPGLDPPYPDDSFGTPALPTIKVDPSNPKRVYVAYQGNYGLFSKATADSKAQDVYFTWVRLAPTSALEATSSTETGTKLAWGLAGAALGLAAAGLVLLVSRTRLAAPQAGRRPSRS